MKHDQTIKIKCSKEEKEQIEKNASEISLSASRYCLNAAIDPKRNKKRMPVVFYKDLVSMAAYLDQVDSDLNVPIEKRDDKWHVRIAEHVANVREVERSLWEL